MKVGKKFSGSILILEVIGELDHHSAADLKAEIEAEFKKGVIRHIVLNLEGLSFMDSSGLGVILGRYKELSKWQGRMLTYGLQPVVEKLFRLTGLNKLVPVHSSLDSCLKELGA